MSEAIAQRIKSCLWIVKHFSKVLLNGFIVEFWTIQRVEIVANSGKNPIDD